MAADQAHCLATAILRIPEAEVEVACPAMAVAPTLELQAEVAEAREETVGQAVTRIHWSLLAGAAEVARSSMAETVHRLGAVEPTSAVAQAAATRIMAILPLAPAAVAVEEDSTTPPAFLQLQRMALMAPTAAAAAPPASTYSTLTAQMEATAGLAAAAVQQGRSGLS
jgi:hypothetical protein